MCFAPPEWAASFGWLGFGWPPSGVGWERAAGRGRGGGRVASERGGSDDTGVLWRSRSNAERGSRRVVAMWGRGLFAVVGLLGPPAPLCVAMLLGLVVVFRVVARVGIDGLRFRGRWDEAIGCLDAGWGWVVVGWDYLVAAVSSLVSTTVSIASRSNSSAVRDPAKLASDMVEEVSVEGRQ